MTVSWCIDGVTGILTIIPVVKGDCTSIERTAFNGYFSSSQIITLEQR